MNTLEQAQALAWVSTDDRIFHLETNASAAVAADVFIALCGEVGKVHFIHHRIDSDQRCLKCQQLGLTLLGRTIGCTEFADHAGTPSTTTAKPLPPSLVSTEESRVQRVMDATRKQREGKVLAFPEKVAPKKFDQDVDRGWLCADENGGDEIA